jgi:hypothetical protein
MQTFAAEKRGGATPTHRFVLAALGSARVPAQPVADLQKADYGAFGLTVRSRSTNFDRKSFESAMPVAVPQIISVGAPPEQHADRVTAEMLEFIVRLRAAVWAKGETTIAPGKMGNPISQARHVARLSNMNGALWPFVHLTPGKRGRYTLDIVEITGWDCLAHRQIDPFDDITDLPPRLWLYAQHLQIVGRPNADPDCSTAGIVLLTHHALSRLCQRCNARRPRDLIVATHALTNAVCEAEVANTLPRPVTNPAGHRLRVKLGGGLGDCVAVLQRHERLDVTTPVCVSILPPDADVAANEIPLVAAAAASACH